MALLGKSSAQLVDSMPTCTSSKSVKILQEARVGRNSAAYSASREWRITASGLIRPTELQSLESQNRFRLSGKSAAQYFVLVAAIAAAILSLYSLVACIRTKLPGRKWPWVLFIILGIGTISINWSTGQWAVAPISVQLFSK
jgi:hypothetical protein